MSNLVMRWSRLAAAALVVSAAALHAQNAERAAYLALLHVPAGGLASLPPDAGISLRYGHFAAGTINNQTNTLAGTLAFVLPDDETNLSFTLGGYDERCPDPECEWKFMGGIGAAHGLYSTQTSGKNGGTMLGVAIDGELGWGAKIFDTSWWGGRIGLPTGLYIATQMNGMRITPYVVPSIAYGHAHLDAPNVERNYGSVRGMIGGGIELATSGGSLRATAGFTYIGVEDAKAGFGASISIRP